MRMAGYGKYRTLCSLVLLLNYCLIINAGKLRNNTVRQQKASENFKKNVVNANYDVENPYPPIGVPGDDTTDYFASYDADYPGPGGRSNISSFFYDTGSSNPDIFPNPEMMIYDNTVEKGSHMEMFTDPLQLGVMDTIKLPDNSLADADLKDHNLIDSVNYVYGITNSPSTKKEWMFIIVMTRILAISISVGTLITLLCAANFETFRKRSKMYPLELNLVASLLTCNILYLTAIVDTSNSTRCEVTAILLHYAHIVCCSWFLVQSKAITSWANDIKYTPDIRYIYFFAYGLPAILVLVFYTLSLEKYETCTYCWMSVENGMLLGCMLPVCIFIISNTIFAIVGQRTLSRKKTEIITSKIHEMLNHDMTTNCIHNPEILEQKQLDDVSLGASEYLNEVPHGNNQPRCSQTESMGMEMTSRCSVEMGEIGLGIGNMNNKSTITMTKIDLTSLSLDNLSWKSVTTKEVDSLKSCLTFCLILQPLFCVCWFMGVIALENCHHWLTPGIFFILSACMYIFIAIHFFTSIPIICEEILEHEFGDTLSTTPVPNQSRQQPTILQQRSMDNIPLLVSNVTPSTAPVTLADAISTISI